MLAGDGASVRERVLGSEHVMATSEVAAGQPPAIQEAQDAVTALVWGGLWSRPGLGLRERSLITLAVVTALNQPGPVELHLRGALRNGLTPEEIAETLLHVGHMQDSVLPRVLLLSPGACSRILKASTQGTPLVGSKCHLRWSSQAQRKDYARAS